MPLIKILQAGQFALGGLTLKTYAEGALVGVSEADAECFVSGGLAEYADPDAIPVLNEEKSAGADEPSPEAVAAFNKLNQLKKEEGAAQVATLQDVAVLKLLAEKAKANIVKQAATERLKALTPPEGSTEA